MEATENGLSDFFNRRMHLEVVQSKRIPWTAHMDGGNTLVYESKVPLDAKARSLLENRLRAHVSRPSHTMLGTV